MTGLLTQKDNLKGLERLNVEWVKRVVAKSPPSSALGSNAGRIKFRMFCLHEVLGWIVGIDPILRKGCHYLFLEDVEFVLVFSGL